MGIDIMVEVRDNRIVLCQIVKMCHKGREFEDNNTWRLSIVWPAGRAVSCNGRQNRGVGAGTQTSERDERAQFVFEQSLFDSEHCGKLILKGSQPGDRLLDPAARHSKSFPHG